MLYNKDQIIKKESVVLIMNKAAYREFRFIQDLVKGNYSKEQLLDKINEMVAPNYKEEFIKSLPEDLQLKLKSE
jgi:hypothetical protein